MPRRSEYASGAPCWIDRISAHLSAAEGFYSGLFGWEYLDEGGYRTALLGGEIVAGFGSATTPREFWTVYLAAKDLAATATEVAARGGTVVMPPMATGDNGSLFLATDPVGTLVGFWAGSRAEGVVLVDEPGAACGYELHVPDAVVAGDFYGGLFGYELARSDERTTLDLDGGSLVDVVEDGSTAPHWLIYFGAADPVATLHRALSSGAKVVEQKADGALILQDPWGARFGVREVR